MKSSQTIGRAIVVGNGFASAENQCIGLVRALGLSNKYSLYMFFEADHRHFAKLAQETIDRDGPILVIASGRDTINIASSIKRLVPDKVFLVQIQHPMSRLHRFDLVITPHHDYYPLTSEAQKQIPWFLRRWVTPRKLPDKRVVLTLGALYQADSVALRNAVSVWHNEMAPLPKPLLVVPIGGPTSHCRYDADLAKQLTASLEREFFKVVGAPEYHFLVKLLRPCAFFS